MKRRPTRPATRPPVVPQSPTPADPVADDSPASEIAERSQNLESEGSPPTPPGGRPDPKPSGAASRDDDVDDAGPADEIRNG
jgi:hypothetical protein